MHQHTARYHQKYRATANPKNRYVPTGQHGYASAHHDCVSGHRRVNDRVHGHHHVNGRVRGRGHLRAGGRDRVDGRDRVNVNGRHRVHVHRRVRDRGRLRADGRDHVSVRVNDRAGADVHVQDCARHHCNTASCFWQAATRQYQQSKPRKIDSTTERYRLVQTPVLRA